MKPLQRPGTFKAEPRSWHVQRFDSGSIGIQIVFAVLSMRDGDQWREPTTGPQSVRGIFWVVKKTGAPNERTVRELASILGWGGTFEEIAIMPPPEVVVQIDVEPQESNGKTYFEVRKMRREDDDGHGELSLEYLLQLDKQHAADLRKIAGKVEKPAAKSAVADEGIPF